MGELHVKYERRPSVFEMTPTQKTELDQFMEGYVARHMDGDNGEWYMNTFHPFTHNNDESRDKSNDTVIRWPEGSTR